MILPIYLYGQEVLRKADAEADLTKKDEILQLVSDMKETLKVADGCGLAAPQVGVPLRILIVDGTEMTETYPELKDFRRTMINPVVLEESAEKCTYQEGCLSVPGYYGDVERPERITMEALDRDGVKQTYQFEGWDAKVMCHEYDHLDGIMYTDKAQTMYKAGEESEETEEAEEE